MTHKCHRLVIPHWHPPRVNQYEGRHWSAKHRAKRQCAEALGLQRVADGVPRAAGKRRVSLAVMLRPRGKTPDADGYWDALLDGLVAAGLLVDDSPEWCECGPVRYERDPNFWGTEITLEDV